MKRERPILFSTPMVQAILNGTKTQTRRIVKGVALDWLGPDMFNPEFVADPDNGLCPYGKEKDVLWVRETWQHTKVLNLHPSDENYGYIYKADDQPWEDYEGWRWKPSIFMPKEACRIKLLIKDVKIERLQDISEEDAISEGVERIKPEGMMSFKSYAVKDGGKGVFPYVSFETLWKSINGHDSWEDNPFVWRVSFERI